MSTIEKSRIGRTEAFHITSWKLQSCRLREPETPEKERIKDQEDRGAAYVFQPGNYK